MAWGATAKTGQGAAKWLSSTTLSTTSRSVGAEKMAVATALPKTSWAKLIEAVGVTATALEIRRISRLSRGLSIKWCGPRLTGRW